jgi:hypothetical protein
VEQGPLTLLQATTSAFAFAWIPGGVRTVARKSLDVTVTFPAKCDVSF